MQSHGRTDRGVVLTALLWSTLGASAAFAQPSTGGTTPGLPPSLILQFGGSMTTDPTEVVSGKLSVKGSIFASGSKVVFLRADIAFLTLIPGRTYRATFRYKILRAPDLGFEFAFNSFTAGVGTKGNSQATLVITGQTGTTGTATLTSTLGPYTDYAVNWSVISNGAIAIDEIQIEDVAANSVVLSTNAEIPSASDIHLAQAFLPPGQVGRTYAAALAAVGGRPPYTFKTGALPLPGGLQLAADGYLSGKPTTNGSFVFEAEVTDATGSSATVPIRTTISPPVPLPSPAPLTLSTGNLAVVQPAEYKAAFRNPLEGFRPLPANAKVFPFASLGRQYVPWNLIENSVTDTVDKIRQQTDRMFGDLPAYNIKVIPRVYLLWPNPMTKYWPSDMVLDDYSSTQFRSRMKALIAKLGEAWNNDPRIAYIETGLIGYWGEQHDPAFSSSGLSPALPPEVEKDFGDAYRDAFPGKLLMNRQAKSLVAYPFGMHWDVFGAFNKCNCGSENETGGVTAALEKPEQINRWRVTARGGEIGPTFIDEPDGSLASRQHAVRMNTQWFVDIIRRLHWDHVNMLPYLDPADQDLWDRATQVQNALGYRFVIDEASFSPLVQPGSDLTLRLKLHNAGSAPFYYPWPLEVSLLDAATRRPVWKTNWDEVDIRGWLPGAHVDVQKKFALPGNLPAGQYAIALAILDPSGMVPGARFAVTNYWMGGRTPLGPVSVGGTWPASQLNEFDDIQSDQSLYYLPPGTRVNGPCSASVDSAAAVSAPGEGVSRTLHVTTGGCNWNVSTDSDWISFTPANGNGAGTVSYTVAGNTGPARQGWLVVAGQIVTVSQAASTLPLVTGVANAANGQVGVVPGSFASIYGSRLSPVPVDDWSKSIVGGRLPVELDGVRVTIAGKPAFINVVTPGQLNIQAPDLPAGPADVIVTTPAGESSPFRTTVIVHSPAFFPWPGNQPVAMHLDYSYAARNGTISGQSSAAAKPGEIIILWGTGFGPTNPAVPSGEIPSVAAAAVQGNVQVTVGSQPARLISAVLSTYPGVYQIAIEVPSALADGDYPISASVGGVQAPADLSLTVHR